MSGNFTPKWRKLNSKHSSSNPSTPLSHRSVEDLERTDDPAAPLLASEPYSQPDYDSIRERGSMDEDRNKVYSTAKQLITQLSPNRQQRQYQLQQQLNEPQDYVSYEPHPADRLSSSHHPYSPNRREEPAILPRRRSVEPKSILMSSSPDHMNNPNGDYAIQILDAPHPLRHAESSPPDSPGAVETDTQPASRRGSTIEEDVCFPASPIVYMGGIDFEALEEVVREENEMLRRERHQSQSGPPGDYGNSSSEADRTSLMKDRRSSSRGRAMSLGVTGFTGFGNSLPPHSLSEWGSPTNDMPPDHMFSGLARKYTSYTEPFPESVKHEPTPYRFTFWSPFLLHTIHARTFSEIPGPGETLAGLLSRGMFWLNVLSPSDNEMRALSKIFHIHPLTSEDIRLEETREKCEVFKNYYFVCFRTFDQDPSSEMYMQPLSIYLIVMKEGIITIHFHPTQHPENVRRRIKQLRDFIQVTPDWINYAMLDDITDSFFPLIRNVEFEVDSIDELVLILKESEQTDMLRRIGHCRKKVMTLLRLLGTKADVIKTLLKRCERGEEGRSGLTSEIALYLGDVADHVQTMLQSLNHYEKISSRSHSNYLAQISIEMTQTNNEINDVLSKLTALGSILVPMNLITGLWGMNVKVPGQGKDDLVWFVAITSGMTVFIIICYLVMRRLKIV
ncbi:hypothetical protein BZG36_00776 [Bifiguratus adelaidae]|uniref:Cora-domain-containing protein n=1 Tax=Bifiguratus adelaidae TaxID=1938954 RepID=A0A261Y6R1_9FUNG|nr:hypothetical protein BZG36_00776 [Bifiguratus adelaidae]